MMLTERISDMHTSCASPRETESSQVTYTIAQRQRIQVDEDGGV